MSAAVQFEKLTRPERGSMRRFPVRICSVPTATPIHTSGTMARRDQPRRPPVLHDQGYHDAGEHEPDGPADRVDRVPGRPGTGADQQHVGRAAGVAAAEHRIPEHHPGQAEADARHEIVDSLLR